MATSYKNRTVTDVKLVTVEGSRQFSVASGIGLNVVTSGYVSEPQAPAGYEMVLFGARANGHAAVVSTGTNTYWITNASQFDLTGLTATAWALFVKYA